MLKTKLRFASKFLLQKAHNSKDQLSCKDRTDKNCISECISIHIKRNFTQFYAHKEQFIKISSKPQQSGSSLRRFETMDSITIQHLRDNDKISGGENISEIPTNRTSKDAVKDVDEPLVLVERIDHLHIMTISMNRAQKRNCVSKEMAQQLLAAFHAYEEDEQMHCAVVHGIGGNFCAGYDLEELAEVEDDKLADYAANIMMDRGPMGPTRMQLSKPVIASIEGWCVAGGLELALMADLRVADTDAKLGLLNRRFGVPLLDGGSVRLPQLIGLSRAMDLILTGRILDASEANFMGLVNIVTKTGAAYGRAMALAKDITTHPQFCLKTDFASTMSSAYSAKSLQKSLENEGMEGLQVLSKESIEGARKFVSGLGKHGKFNVSAVAEKQEWQKEYEKMEKGGESKSSDL